jgi:uncharacterized protein
MRCPICKKEVALGEPDFPFCSERCRLIDLGRWAAEEYRIPVAGDPLQAEIDEEAE